MVCGWNRSQPTVTGDTTDDNRSVKVRLSVVRYLSEVQPVGVAVVTKMGQKPDPTGPENSICEQACARPQVHATPQLHHLSTG